jgi:hypothetical protein
LHFKKINEDSSKELARYEGSRESTNGYPRLEEMNTSAKLSKTMLNAEMIKNYEDREN